jgi:hypothetical protein
MNVLGLRGGGPDNATEDVVAKLGFVKEADQTPVPGKAPPLLSTTIPRSRAM